MNSQEEQKQPTQTELKRPTPLSNYPDASDQQSELKKSFVGSSKHNFVYKDKDNEGVPVTTIQIGKDRDTSTGGSRKFQPTSQRSKSFIKQSGFAYQSVTPSN
jgi:hypothetical protein